jgi:hypothetical protein
MPEDFAMLLQNGVLDGVNGLIEEWVVRATATVSQVFEPRYSELTLHRPFLCQWVALVTTSTGCDQT